ncbi:hypothetical protein ASPSYDRAFT_52326 [Aspergillus sydowii CBS 593.65]|uniref:Uncharacterized protein n=1 Tax=Aspergillus sydowii CBS 593.65 TaxID=1036612 RepID=A0A1L9SY28_9EURO|nr:uncharacterized protein ASPSYDRAFT_52326 [Aspergillus sydowii CBS 593.65]OJJ52132.1 hypothetical protein ASPSYDRAFT_52326 [Aspergillus sydowii CBS 593.65]
MRRPLKPKELNGSPVHRSQIHGGDTSSAKAQVCGRSLPTTSAAVLDKRDRKRVGQIGKRVPPVRHSFHATRLEGVMLPGYRFLFPEDRQGQPTLTCPIEKESPGYLSPFSKKIR